MIGQALGWIERIKMHCTLQHRDIDRYPCNILDADILSLRKQPVIDREAITSISLIIINENRPGNHLPTRSKNKHV